MKYMIFIYNLVEKRIHSYLIYHCIIYHIHFLMHYLRFLEETSQDEFTHYKTNLTHFLINISHDLPVLNETFEFVIPFYCMY